MSNNPPPARPGGNYSPPRPLFPLYIFPSTSWLTFPFCLQTLIFSLTLCATPPFIALALISSIDLTSQSLASLFALSPASRDWIESD